MKMLKYYWVRYNSRNMKTVHFEGTYDNLESALYNQQHLEYLEGLSSWIEIEEIEE